jgi:hypothetical protein
MRTHQGNMYVHHNNTVRNILRNTGTDKKIVMLMVKKRDEHLAGGVLRSPSARASSCTLRNNSYSCIMQLRTGMFVLNLQYTKFSILVQL